MSIYQLQVAVKLFKKKATQSAFIVHVLDHLVVCVLGGGEGFDSVCFPTVEIRGGAMVVAPGIS